MQIDIVDFINDHETQPSTSTSLARANYKFDLGNDELNKTSLAINGSSIEREHMRYTQCVEAIDFFYNKKSIINSVFQYVSSDSSRFYPRDKVDALKQLTISSWKSLLHTTGIYDVMPQLRKDEWNNQKDWIEFSEDNIKATLFALLQEQGKFTAEKVEGCFLGLSKAHVTNRPEGFYKRCIFELSYNDYSFIDSRLANIHDLRYLICQLTKREFSFFTEHHTYQLLNRVPKDGQWYEIDGGAWKIRRYLKGTAHIEFHPDIAWQLNSILATIYGAAIPEKHRKPVKVRKAKEVKLRQDLLPLEVISKLADLRPSSGRNKPQNGYSYYFHSYDVDKHLVREMHKVLTLIGGKKQSSGSYLYDYDITNVLSEVIRTGQIPDKFSHQYYPTNEELAQTAVDMLNIGPNELTLEPSAGQGGIAKFLPSDSHLVEVCELNCRILNEKGFENVINDDFIKYAKETTHRYDNIAMNPPFSENRALVHLTAALNLLNYTGCLVAILPASAVNYELPDGFEYSFSKPIENQFEGTSVTVVMLKATRNR
ncbi:protein of unknown function [Vibrio xiamenensis]|uniref:DUF4942 domain-containing protein n=1 Tax=Vibrio xiamenensis TaxID=861298 RepID=A0A1G8CDB4_9VIBR|nr:DUF4942 domain-containing protein [Vibrio xiamenensis]SDH43415.1 protein of unknown function [Vibrio xiamenensis]